MQKYDEKIHAHYKVVADKHGLSCESTMEDLIVRNRETDAALAFVDFFKDARSDSCASSEGLTIMDIGCGNGYTLGRLSEKYPNNNYIGIELSDELRALAETRFVNQSNVSIIKGDIRNADFYSKESADILICQRVLINLLDPKDQERALLNIIQRARRPSLTKKGGALLFFECFTTSLNLLNKARSEFDLPAIGEAEHNLYLPDKFFSSSFLRQIEFNVSLLKPNFLSTHYFVTRVLHAALSPNEQSFKRNSEFVKFFSQALIPDIGDYSPLKLFVFERVV